MCLEFRRKVQVRGAKSGPSLHTDGVEAIRLVRSPRVSAKRKEVRLGPLVLQHCDIK